MDFHYDKIILFFLFFTMQALNIFAQSPNNLEKFSIKDQMPYDEIYSKKRGTYHIFEAGVSLEKINEWSLEQDLMFHTVNGFQIIPQLCFGIGIGANILERKAFITPYLDLRGDVLSNKKFTPFYFGGYGYGWITPKREDTEHQTFEEEGGLFHQYGLGFKVKNKLSQWTLSIGHFSQEASFKTCWINSPDFIDEREVSYKRYFVKTGIAF